MQRINENDLTYQAHDMENGAFEVIRFFNALLWLQMPLASCSLGCFSQEPFIIICSTLAVGMGLGKVTTLPQAFSLK